MAKLTEFITRRAANKRAEVDKRFKEILDELYRLDDIRIHSMDEDERYAAATAQIPLRAEMRVLIDNPPKPYPLLRHPIGWFMCVVTLATWVIFAIEYSSRGS